MTNESIPPAVPGSPGVAGDGMLTRDIPEVNLPVSDIPNPDSGVGIGVGGPSTFEPEEADDAAPS